MRLQTARRSPVKGFNKSALLIVNLQALQQLISEYFKTQPVKKAWIFGSFARGEATSLSDVDVLVEYEQGGVSLFRQAQIICDLEKLLDRSVDLVQEKLLRPNIRENIIRDRKLIYERSC